jgi:hypothetical protein
MQKTDVNTALAIFFVATAVVLIGALVATTVVNQQAAFADPPPGKKVTICHNEHTTTIGAPAVAGHVRNHDEDLGACLPD